MSEHQSSTSAVSAEFASGSLIAERYEVRELLGVGGMGAVYLAEDNLMQKVVAIKIMHRHIALEPQANLRFQNEAQAISRLEHENIVRIFHYGVDQAQRSYLVMEHLNGLGLQSELDKGTSYNLETGIEILSDICDGLSYAHANGVIHRDLKPSNVVIVEKNGKRISKLLDFGIAKFDDAEKRDAIKLTQTGDLLGSPQYMSPEQCLSNVVDKRTDIYSLGCLIYALFSGHPPFPHENAYEVISSQICDMPESLHSRRPDLAQFNQLDAIILKCMAKEPEDRFGSVLQVKEALIKVLDENAKAGKQNLMSLVEIERLKVKARKKKRLDVRLLALIGGSLVTTGISAWLIGSWQTEREQKFDSLYTSGQRDIDSGLYSSAQDKISKALLLAKLNGNSPEKERAALEQLADIAFIEGDIVRWNNVDKQLNELNSRIREKFASIDDALKKRLAAGNKNPGIDNAALIERANDSAAILMQASQYKQALTTLEHAFTLASRSLDRNDPSLGRCLHNLGLAYHKTGNLGKAKEFYEASISFATRTQAQSAPAIGKDLIGISRIEMQTGNISNAEANLKRTITLYRNNFGAQSEQAAWAKVNLGELYINQKKPDLAQMQLEEAKEIFDQTSKPDLDKKTRCYALLASVLKNKNALSNALALMESTEKVEERYMSWVLMAMGDEVLRSNTVDAEKRADSYYLRALAMTFRMRPPSQERALEIVKRLENLHQKRNTVASLIPIYKAKLMQDEVHYGEVSVVVAEDHAAESRLFRLGNELENAEEELIRAQKILEKCDGDNSQEIFENYGLLLSIQLDELELGKAGSTYQKIQALWQAGGKKTLSPAYLSTIERFYQADPASKTTQSASASSDPLRDYVKRTNKI